MRGRPQGRPGEPGETAQPAVSMMAMTADRFSRVYCEPARHHTRGCLFDLHFHNELHLREKAGQAALPRVTGRGHGRAGPGNELRLSSPGHMVLIWSLDGCPGALKPQLPSPVPLNPHSFPAPRTSAQFSGFLVHAPARLPKFLSSTMVPVNPWPQAPTHSALSPLSSLYSSKKPAWPSLCLNVSSCRPTSPLQRA